MASDDTTTLPEGAPPPRLCLLVKWPSFDGYGFSLHTEKGRPGQHIGKIDAASPAEKAGLRDGDRIFEVNGESVSGWTHKQVVENIKAGGEKVTLLVLTDADAEFYSSRDITVSSRLTNLQRGSAELQPEPGNGQESEATTEPVQNGHSTEVAAAADETPAEPVPEVAPADDTSTLQEAEESAGSPEVEEACHPPEAEEAPALEVTAALPELSPAHTEQVDVPSPVEAVAEVVAVDAAASADSSEATPEPGRVLEVTSEVTEVTSETSPEVTEDSSETSPDGQQLSVPEQETEEVPVAVEPAAPTEAETAKSDSAPCLEISAVESSPRKSPPPPPPARNGSVLSSSPVAGSSPSPVPVEEIVSPDEDDPAAAVPEPAPAPATPSPESSAQDTAPEPAPAEAEVHSEPAVADDVPAASETASASPEPVIPTEEPAPADVEIVTSEANTSEDEVTPVVSDAAPVEAEPEAGEEEPISPKAASPEPVRRPGDVSFESTEPAVSESSIPSEPATASPEPEPEPKSVAPPVVPNVKQAPEPALAADSSLKKTSAPETEDWKNLSVAEMRARLKSKKRHDPRNDHLSFKQRHEIVQNM